MLEDKNQNKTQLENLGEFGLIDHLTKDIKISQASTIKSIGDDAAVLDFKNKSNSARETSITGTNAPRKNSLYFKIKPIESPRKSSKNIFSQTE